MQKWQTQGRGSLKWRGSDVVGVARLDGEWGRGPETTCGSYADFLVASTTLKAVVPAIERRGTEIRRPACPPHSGHSIESGAEPMG